MVTPVKESQFLQHVHCESCGSSDAAAEYTDGHIYCHKCNQYIADSTALTTNHSKISHAKTELQRRGSPAPIKNRRISLETARELGIDRYGRELRFNYCGSDGVLCGVKTLRPGKAFSIEGKVAGLWGAHLYADCGKYLVITEGEFDAASVFEVFGRKRPAVSLPNGVGSTQKAIQASLPKLQGYENIILFLDNDEAGRAATQTACELLPTGRVKIARMPLYKDASDALQRDDPDAISQAIYGAKTWLPSGIVDGSSLRDVISQALPPAAHSYSLPGLQSLTRGIRWGEMVVLTGGSGSGKSSLSRSIAHDLLQCGERVGYVALEESNRRTAVGLMSIAHGKALHLSNPSSEELCEIFDQTLKKWQLFLYDGFGSFQPDVIIKAIEYMILSLDVRVVVLDHISIVTSGLDGDERRCIDQLVTSLRSLVERTKSALFLVCHLSRKSGDQPHEEGARVTMKDLRGSQSIGQLADIVIGLERNQQSESDADNVTVRVLKNRFSGEVGIACRAWYDKNKCAFSERLIDENTAPTFSPF
ncbi:hypothetical protein OMCYN_01663 [cyanobiont of Ornithocercus magnificus]|nr:hypothetical protein OMCYN_01663 [cyanobiont of Ornithocercus magnificus]